MNFRTQMQKRQREYRAELENELLESAVEKEQELHRQLEQLDTERFEWEQCKEELQDRIDELTNSLHRAKLWRTLSGRLPPSSAARKTALDKIRLVGKYPSEPRQIVDYFLGHFGDRLAFTERGLASLDSCTASAEVRGAFIRWSPPCSTSMRTIQWCW